MIPTTDDHDPIHTDDPQPEPDLQPDLNARHGSVEPDASPEAAPDAEPVTDTEPGPDTRHAPDAPHHPGAGHGPDAGHVPDPTPRPARPDRPGNPGQPGQPCQVALIRDARGRIRAMNARQLRRLACTPRIALIGHHHGTTADLGRTRREPDARLRRLLLARDRTCRFPGCTTGHDLHAHHVRWWSHGGPTDLDNLADR